MRLLLLIFLLSFSCESHSQNKSKKNVYLVKYHYADSVIEFTTSNVDTIRNKSAHDLNLPDSIETYRNDKLNGPKIIFYEGIIYRNEYKKDKLISESHYETDGRIVYLSKIEPSQLDSTIMKLASGNNYVSYAYDDTLIVTNKTIPLLNLAVSFTGKGLTMQSLGQFSSSHKYLLKMVLLDKPTDIIKIEVITLIDGLAKTKKYRTETLIIPVK